MKNQNFSNTMVIKPTTTAKGLNATKITDFEEVTITAKPSFPTIIPEKKERCGEGIGPCKNGECCSKKGWCGKTEKHCNIKEGCQTKFGMCQFKSKATETLSLKKCGKNVGSCEEGFCCSKLGLCVKNSDNNNCDTSKGCQPEFGECH